jgi:hypothetical protein
LLPLYLSCFTAFAGITLIALGFSGNRILSKWWGQRADWPARDLRGNDAFMKPACLEELGSEAMDLIRSMIREITVVPCQYSGGVDLELAGDLARILHLYEHDESKRPGHCGLWAFWNCVFGCGDLQPPLPNTARGIQGSSASI